MLPLAAGWFKAGQSALTQRRAISPWLCSRTSRVCCDKPLPQAQELAAELRCARGDLGREESRAVALAAALAAERAALPAAMAAAAAQSAGAAQAAAAQQAADAARDAVAAAAREWQAQLDVAQVLSCAGLG
jgi:hypothetical protein